MQIMELCEEKSGQRGEGKQKLHHQTKFHLVAASRRVLVLYYNTNQLSSQQHSSKFNKVVRVSNEAFQWP